MSFSHFLHQSQFEDCLSKFKGFALRDIGELEYYMNEKFAKFPNVLMSYVPKYISRKYSMHTHANPAKVNDKMSYALTSVAVCNYLTMFE